MWLKRLVAAEFRILSQFSLCEIHGGRSGSGTGIFIRGPMLHTHLHLHAALTRTNERILGNCSKKSNDLSEIGEHWIEKYFHVAIILYYIILYHFIILYYIYYVIYVVRNSKGS
jgi:hypothetical protein